jgi:glycosyltransferase involved in cell wall biosynthesis
MIRLREWLRPGAITWPCALAAVLCFGAVILAPGDYTYNDPSEYEELARSLLHGRYAFTGEFGSQPAGITMLREPGYPLFRAGVYALVGVKPQVILFLQAVLTVLTVFIAARTVRRLDPRWELPVAWLLAIYPGFWFFAAQHYTETVTAFLLVLVAYGWVRVGEVLATPRVWRWAAFTGMACGAALLTRASFQYLPVALAAWLFFPERRRKAFVVGALIMAMAYGMALPWVMRNGKQFGQYQLTIRTGIGLYTRALKAEASWDRLWASYGSVLVGRATIMSLMSSADPIVVQLWEATWRLKNDLLAEGKSYAQADAIMGADAAHRIFASPSVTARFILWSGVDLLRMFGITSPLAPTFGVELIASHRALAHTVRTQDLMIILGAHAIQLVWWVLMACGFWALFRARAWRHPSFVLVGYAAVVHAPFDLIPRYAVPILPWIAAFIAAAVFPPLGIRSRRDILFLTESVNPHNGWGAYAHGLIEALRASGASMRVLTSDAESEGPRLPRIHASRAAYAFAGFRLRLWLWRHPCAVIHVASEPYARLVRAFGRTPFIITIHGTYAHPAAQGPAWAVRLFQEALQNAQTIMAVSAYTQAHLSADARHKCSVIPNGYDPAIIHEPFDSAPTHGTPLIFSVGAIKPRKGFDRLIAGFAEFCKTHPHAELVIAGRADRPDVQEALVQQVRLAGLSERVRFTGEISRAELLGWYRACDVFALTPVEDGGFEGFGLVYLEAQIFGKPCIGSRDSAGAEVITEGETGFLADPDNPASIAEALRCAMRLHPYDVASAHPEYAWSHVAQAYLQTYDTIARS